MIKKYFTDGLIQIAIALSLMRIDLQSYLDVYNEQDIEEFIHGPTSAFTQTRFHNQNWNRDVGAFIHPKHVDRPIRELFRDLHALGQYGGRDAINTRIQAYLVNSPHEHVLPSENAQLSNGQQSPNHDNSTAEGNGTNTATTGTGNPLGNEQEESPKQEEAPHPVGDELTKEDMDLIDVLWRQDMDLGVGREMFDANLRRELEKERELELEKQQQQESFADEKSSNAGPDAGLPPPNGTFTLDNETGELVPSVEEPQPEPAAPAAPPAEAPELLDPLQLELEDALQLLGDQVQQHQQQQPPVQAGQQPQPLLLERQTSLEARWADVANLLSMDPPPPPAAPHAALLNNASLAVTPNATDFNMTDMSLPTNASAPFGDPFNLTSLPLPAVMPGGDDANTTLFNLDTHMFAAEPPSALPVVAAAAPPAAASSAPSSGPPALFSNASAAFQPHLLSELLGENDLDALDLNAIDLNNTEEAMRIDDESADSAVASLAGSVTPTSNLSDSLSNTSTSLYDGMEGATGGRPKNAAAAAASLTKFEPKPELYDSAYSHGSSSLRHYTPMNDSDSFADDYSEANPRHVAHNHTYPLQPGQTPREERRRNERRATSSSIPLSRDEKKARLLKIPFTMSDIIDTSVDDFNDMLDKYTLSEPQLQLIRDIRRRGKNKVAAQNCRKRKMEVIQSLEDEVEGVRKERDRLFRQRTSMDKQLSAMKQQYHQLYDEVFRSLRDERGRPYDPTEFALQQTSDGNVFLVPVNGTEGIPTATTSRDRDRDEKPKRKSSSKKQGGRR